MTLLVVPSVGTRVTTTSTVPASVTSASAVVDAWSLLLPSKLPVSKLLTGNRPGGYSPVT